MINWLIDIYVYIYIIYMINGLIDQSINPLFHELMN